MDWNPRYLAIFAALVVVALLGLITYLFYKMYFEDYYPTILDMPWYWVAVAGAGVATLAMAGFVIQDKRSGNSIVGSVDDFKRLSSNTTELEPLVDTKSPDVNSELDKHSTDAPLVEPPSVEVEKDDVETLPPPEPTKPEDPEELKPLVNDDDDDIASNIE